MSSNPTKGRHLIPAEWWEPRDNVLDLLSFALHRKQTIPQDLLYRVHGGATLWEHLTRRVPSTLRLVYDQFRHLHGPVDYTATQVRQHLEESGVSSQEQLSVLALGCGDGWREQAICKGLLQHNLAQSLKVALIDLSPDLVAMAHKNFAEVIPSEVYPRVMDFTDTRRLRDLRATFSSPTIALLIGNTIGNVDERLMLFDLSKALSPKDFVMIEVLMHDLSDAVVTFDERTAEGDARADLILNPLRQIGCHSPDPKRLFIRQQTTDDGGVITRKYVYRFASHEAREIPHHRRDLGGINIVSGVEIALLEVKSMSREYLQSLLEQFFAEVHIWVHPYKVEEGRTIPMGYAFVSIPTLSGSESQSKSGSSSSSQVFARWDGMCIGVCSPSEMYVFAESLEDGAEVRKRDGRRFCISETTKLYNLLKAFAESSDGKTITWDGALLALSGAVSAARIYAQQVQRAEASQGSHATDHDKRIAAKEIYSEFQSAMQKDSSKLSSKIADRARELRDELKKSGVSCTGQGPTLFSASVHEKRVRAAPRCRCLLDTGSGNFTFGSAPSRPS